MVITITIRKSTAIAGINQMQARVATVAEVAIDPEAISEQTNIQKKPSNDYVKKENASDARGMATGPWTTMPHVEAAARIREE